MPTTFSFSKRIHISDIRPTAQSVGAHLAAKLECFGTDERTLTDELCDMLCAWLGIEATRRARRPKGFGTFQLTLSKTTTATEVRTGADLELIVSTPLGAKRCLIQAKVLDPSTGKLRCDSTAGWKKLRQQLVLARNEVGDLAFLLVYVPGSMLDRGMYGYSTYEQRLLAPGHSTHAAFYGATLISANDLLGKSGRWRYAKAKVPEITPGQFRNGVPLWRFLTELLLCRRGVWAKASENNVVQRQFPAYRSLEIGASEVSNGAWSELQSGADQWLDESSQGPNEA